jgi:hypothetical protein
MCLVDTRNSTHAQADRCPNLCATHRQYNFNIRGDTPGNKTIVGQLTQPDSNPANDKDAATVDFAATCGQPTADNTQPACPDVSTYVGPDSKPIPSGGTFGSTCCVSGACCLTLGANGMLRTHHRRVARAQFAALSHLAPYQPCSRLSLTWRLPLV